VEKAREEKGTTFYLLSAKPGTGRGVFLGWCNCWRRKTTTEDAGKKRNPSLSTI